MPNAAPPLAQVENYQVLCERSNPRNLRSITSEKSQLWQEEDTFQDYKKGHELFFLDLTTNKPTASQMAAHGVRMHSCLTKLIRSFISLKYMSQTPASHDKEVEDRTSIL